MTFDLEKEIRKATAAYLESMGLPSVCRECGGDYPNRHGLCAGCNAAELQEMRQEAAAERREMEGE